MSRVKKCCIETRNLFTLKLEPKYAIQKRSAHQQAELDRKQLKSPLENNSLRALQVFNQVAGHTI